MGSETDVIHNMYSTDPTRILLVPSGPVVITELSPFEPISQLIRTAVDDLLHELNPKTIRIIFLYVMRNTQRILVPFGLGVDEKLPYQPEIIYQSLSYGF